MTDYDFITEVNEYFDVLGLDKSKNTIVSYRNAVKKFFDFLDVKSFGDIRNITSKDCRSYQAFLKDNGLQPSSANANVRPLKVLFNWLVENEYLDSSPFNKVKYIKEPKREKDILTEEETFAIVQACDRLEDKVIIAILLTTGLRRDEITSLRLEDYHKCHIQVIGKGDKQRTLILHDSVCELLNNYIKIRNRKYKNEDSWIFISKNGGRFTGEAIRLKVKKAMLNAGIDEERIKKLSVHTLRHTFTANLLESGADIRVAQKALGHGNIETTMRYAHLRNSALDKAMLNTKTVL